MSLQTLSTVSSRKIFRSSLLPIFVIAILGYFNPQNPGYIGVQPHPYLVVGIIFSLVAHFRQTIGTSPILMILYIYFYYQSVDSQSVERYFTIETAFLPFSILILPMLTGYYLDKRKQLVDEYSIEIGNKKKQLDELSLYNDILNQERNQTEQRILSQTQTAARVFERAQLLESNNISDMAQTLVHLTCEQTLENNCYLYLIKHHELRLEAFRDPNGRNLPEVITSEEIKQFPLMDIAWRKKILAKSEDVESTEQSTSHGLATPLLSPAGTVLGIIVVNEMDFSNYVPTTFTTMQSLGMWGGSCISRALRSTGIAEVSYRDALTGLFSYHYLSLRIKTIYKNHQRRNAQFGVLQYSISTPDEIPSQLNHALFRLFAEQLGKLDSVADTIATSEDHQTFYLIFDNFDVDQLENTHASILHRFDDTKAKLNINTAELHPKYFVINPTEYTLEDVENIWKTQVSTESAQL